ncbi:MAG: hypothetical protein ACMVO5_07755 [Polymorphobacter sp.]|uniref:hypothetical protein n=1 Tax=Polymorphobacter sp. TaxID=1909290 RepID=UPI003A882753
MGRVPHVLLMMALAGCAGGEARDWPSLAPRAGEVSPLVPRVPLGACVGCGPDAEVAAAEAEAAAADSLGVTALPAPVRPVLPGDMTARLDGIEAGIAAVEAAWPGARTDGLAAIAAAGGGAVETEAAVQASRFEALFQPLGPEDAALTALEAILGDAEGGAAFAGRVAGLRARLDALEVVRAGGLEGGR